MDSSTPIATPLTASGGKPKIRCVSPDIRSVCVARSRCQIPSRASRWAVSNSCRADLQIEAGRLQRRDVTRRDQHAVLEPCRLDGVEARNRAAVDHVLVRQHRHDERLAGLHHLPVTGDQLAAREHGIQLRDPAADQLAPRAAGHVDRGVVHPHDLEIDDRAIVVANRAFDHDEVQDAVEGAPEALVQVVAPHAVVRRHGPPNPFDTPRSYVANGKIALFGADWRGLAMGSALGVSRSHGEEEPLYVERHFAARPESSPAARRFVADAVRETSVDRGDAMLLTAELVNNAIVHAGSDFEVRVSVDDDRAIRVSVVDHVPELLLLSRPATSQGGRGLALIDAVADAWGFERRGAEKLAWFQLATTHSA